MEYNSNKMVLKHFTGLLLVISIVSINLLPVFSKRATAQWVVSDPPVEVATAAIASATVVENTRKTLKDILDSVAMVFARLAIQRVVNATVVWAQNGFYGNPAYAVNPRQYFTDIADGVAGEYIASSTQLSFLCSPFQAQIRIALREQYISEPQFQCTLSQVVGNIDAFYSDFSQGGWNGWFVMTQTTGGNPYDSYINAKIDLDSRVVSAIGLESQQLEWNQGFLSWTECDGIEDPGTPTADGTPTCYGGDGRAIPRRVVTPGATVKAQLDKVLPSGLESLITVNHVEQLIEAFATGLLNRFVFNSSGGLFKSSPLPTTTPGNSRGTAGGSTGGTGGFPSPNPTPTPTPTPTPQPPIPPPNVLSCTASASQLVLSGGSTVSVTFSVTAPAGFPVDNNYIWDSPTASPSADNDPFFDTSYSSNGTKTATVSRSGYVSGSCSVDVVSP